MKTSRKIIVVLLSVIVAVAGAVFFYSFQNQQKDVKKTVAGTTAGIAVVELFTSEGCSSCPSADALAARLKSEHNSSVYLLSFHVDYWNRLGWKDTFSNPAFSNRQRNYARALNLSSVYTPQMIVNGREEFTGSNENRLKNAIAKATLKPTIPLQVTGKFTDKTFHVSYTINEVENLVLNIAFIQPEASTAVKAGENNGRQLHHVNVVRALKVIDILSRKGSAEIDLDMVEEAEKEHQSIIAYVQDKTTMEIKGAVSFEL